jgi:signal transduction histidine kinase
MTRRHEGMGLGLAIVRAVVRAHHGRVWAESPGKDQGTMFTIALPLAA